MNFDLVDAGPSFNLPMVFPVVGTGFDDRPSVIRKRCARGMKVLLEREPDNPHDTNAIAVHLLWKNSAGAERQDQIGYVPSDLATELSDLLHRRVLAIKKASVELVVAMPDMDSPRVRIRLEGSLGPGVEQLPLSGT